MAEKNQLFYLMQLAGGTFPSGGFSQSWGLETYVTQGRVKDSDSLKEFLEGYLESTVNRCEGPILCEAFRLAKDWREEKLMELEELSCAIKVTRESREASLRMGKAFLRIMAEILDDVQLSRLKKRCRGGSLSYPVAYGVVCAKLGLELTASLEAFVFSTVNALVQSAVKLIPLGNTQAQSVLLEAQPVMERAVRESEATEIDAISNFCPGLDLASLIHETLPVRLYMS